MNKETKKEAEEKQHPVTWEQLREGFLCAVVVAVILGIGIFVGSLNTSLNDKLDCTQSIIILPTHIK